MKFPSSHNIRIEKSLHECAWKKNHKGCASARVIFFPGARMQDFPMRLLWEDGIFILEDWPKFKKLQKKSILMRHPGHIGKCVPGGHSRNFGKSSRMENAQLIFNRQNCSKNNNVEC